MRNLSNRDIRILQMRENGVSGDEIAIAVGLSIGAMPRMFQKLRAEETHPNRMGPLLKKFREADGLDKKWKTVDVQDSFSLSATTWTAFGRYFEMYRIKDISLREFMDLVISDRTHPKPEYLFTPMLDIHSVGLKGFWSVVQGLTEADLGDQCNGEWRKRLARLQKCTRIVGPHCRRSRLIKTPDWLTGYFQRHPV